MGNFDNEKKLIKCPHCDENIQNQGKLDDLLQTEKQKGYENVSAHFRKCYDKMGDKVSGNERAYNSSITQSIVICAICKNVLTISSYVVGFNKVDARLGMIIPTRKEPCENTDCRARGWSCESCFLNIKTKVKSEPEYADFSETEKPF